MTRTVTVPTGDVARPAAARPTSGSDPACPAAPAARPAGASASEREGSADERASAVDARDQAESLRSFVPQRLQNAASAIVDGAAARRSTRRRSDVPRRRRRRQQAASARRLGPDGRGSRRRRLPRQPRLQLALDHRRGSPTPPSSSCFMSEQRAAAQAAAHLVEVPRRQLAHRPIELELLDRAQHQRLLALERGARPARQRLAERLGVAARRAAPASGRTRRGGAGGADRQADEDEMLGRRAPRQDHGDGRRDQRRQHEEVPGLNPSTSPVDGWKVRRTARDGAGALVEVAELIVQLAPAAPASSRGADGPRRGGSSFGRRDQLDRREADHRRAGRADQVRERATPGG